MHKDNTLGPRLTKPRIRSKITQNKDPFSTVRAIRSSSQQRAIVTAGKVRVFGGFWGVYGKTIGQINFKLGIYQEGRDL